jgi:hypothetical protein
LLNYGELKCLFTILVPSALKLTQWCFPARKDCR